MHPRVIHIHALAPPKPAWGAACNGCGVCCLDQPCPLGMLLSRRSQGPCLALQWRAPEQRYVCGALLPQTPATGHGLARAWQALRQRLVRRWIGAGAGCDCSLEPAGSATIEASQPNPGEPRHD